MTTDPDAARPSARFAAGRARRRAQRQLAVLAGIAAASALALLGWAPIATRLPALMSLPAHLGLAICPLRAITGIACPGCGGTRALLRLSHADVAGALALNPLVTSAAIGAALLAAVCIAAPAAADRLLDGGGSVARSRNGRIALAALLGLEMLLATMRGM
jgi:hypothetical protein